MKALRALALRYPEAQEGVACAGTAIEKITVKARNKAFLFLGRTNAMVKLQESLGEANERAAKEPSRYKVGTKGWVTVSFGEGDALPLNVLEKWIDESYRLIVPKELVAMLDGDPPAVKKTTKKTAKKSR